MKSTLAIMSRKLPAEGFEAIADSATAMVDVWKYDTRQYVYVSDAIKYVVGYEAQELLEGGVDFVASVMHPDDRAGTLRATVALRKEVEYLGPGVDDSKPYARFEYRLKHKDGHWVWLHGDAQPDA
jgi:PAS domain-containing protein